MSPFLRAMRGAAGEGARSATFPLIFPSRKRTLGGTEPSDGSKGRMMVTYRYSCEKCGYEFDFDQRITDPPRRRCPKCRGSVYRVIHPVGHILKGSGFYTTDYRTQDFKKRETEEKPGAGAAHERDSKKPKDQKHKK